MKEYKSQNKEDIESLCKDLLKKDANMAEAELDDRINDKSRRD